MVSKVIDTKPRPLQCRLRPILLSFDLKLEQLGDSTTNDGMMVKSFNNQVLVCSP